VYPLSPGRLVVASKGTVLDLDGWIGLSDATPVQVSRFLIPKEANAVCATDCSVRVPSVWNTADLSQTVGGVVPPFEGKGANEVGLVEPGDIVAGVK